MGRTHVHCTRFPNEMWEAIKEKAAKQGMTPSYYVRSVIDEALRKDQEDLS